MCLFVFSNHMSWCLFKILKKSSQRSAHPFLGNCWQSQMEVSCTTSKWVNIFSKEQLRVPKIPLGGISSAWWEHSLKKLHLLVWLFDYPEHSRISYVFSWFACGYYGDFKEDAVLGFLSEKSVPLPSALISVLSVLFLASWALLGKLPKPLFWWFKPSLREGCAPLLCCCICWTLLPEPAHSSCPVQEETLCPLSPCHIHSPPISQLTRPVVPQFRIIHHFYGRYCVISWLH